MNPWTNLRSIFGNIFKLQTQNLVLKKTALESGFFQQHSKKSTIYTALKLSDLLTYLR